MLVKPVENIRGDSTIVDVLHIRNQVNIPHISPLGLVTEVVLCKFVDIKIRHGTVPFWWCEFIVSIVVLCNYPTNLAKMDSVVRIF